MYCCESLLSQKSCRRFPKACAAVVMLNQPSVRKVKERPSWDRDALRFTMYAPKPQGCIVQQWRIIYDNQGSQGQLTHGATERPTSQEAAVPLLEHLFPGTAAIKLGPVYIKGASDELLLKARGVTVLGVEAA
jgi:hypothetical protein